MAKICCLLLTIAIVCSSVILNAQQKVAYLDVNELLLWMPEIKSAEAEFNKLSEQRIESYTKSVAEYQSKDSLFKADSAKWSPAIKDVRKIELLMMEQRIKTMADNWEEDNRYQNERVMQPVKKRALAAIEAVVKENGFTKWVDKSEVGKYPGAKNILALVKKKLASTPNLSTEIKFEKPDFYMGSIEEKEVTHNFGFTNTGNAPLTITNVKVESRLVKAQWPKNAIKPGEQGVIAVTYNATGQSGEFDQYVSVESNAKESPFYLHLRGIVGSYLKSRLTEQFVQIMRAFPGNFESLKDGISNNASTSYFSKVSIYQSRRTEIIKGKNDKSVVLSLIGSYDSKQKGMQQYMELLKVINSITLNGATLKIYKTEQNDVLISTKWRLDNTKNSISKEYQLFTIELTCIYMNEKNVGVSISFGAD